MQKHSLTASQLDRAEIAVAALVTIAAVALQWVATRSAGPLWRDETAGVVVANLPTMSDVWNNLQYDSFPALWMLAARAVGTAAGAGNDAAFRSFGFLTGVGLVIALWIYARALRHSLPMVSLALLALTPSVVIWGTSARAYGLAMVLVVLTGASIWRFADRPGAWRFVAACAAAIASVHTIFFNSVMVLAFCTGGAAVFATRRNWRGAPSVIAVGGVAALSLAPYSQMLQDAATWRVLARVPEYGLDLFWVNLYEVLRPGGIWSIVIWTSLFGLSLYAAARTLTTKPRLEADGSRHGILIFTSVTMLTGLVAYLLFLENLSYYPSPWYYLPLLAMCAVCIDGISGALIRTPAARTFRLVGTVVVAVATISVGFRGLQRPMTNAHQAAAYLESHARVSDVIVVDPWFLGVSMYRFYNGSAPWMTVPPIGRYAFHRYDLVKENMIVPDQRLPARPVITKVADVLQSGGRVFIAGRLRRPDSTGDMPLLPAAPNASGVWLEPAYRRQWGVMVGSFVRRHAISVDSIPLPRSRLAPYEDMHLFVASGWKP